MYLGQESKTREDVTKQRFDIVNDCKYAYQLVSESAPEVPVENSYGNCNMKILNDIADDDIPGVGKSITIFVEGIPAQAESAVAITPNKPMSKLMLFKPMTDGSVVQNINIDDYNLDIRQLSQGNNNVDIDGSYFDKEGKYLLVIKDIRGDAFKLKNSLVNKEGCSLVLDTKEHKALTPKENEVIAATPWQAEIGEVCLKTIPAGVKQDRCTECFRQGKVWSALGCIGTDTGSFVGSFFNVGLGLAGGIAFLFLIYGGFLYLTSGGNPETLQKAKEIIVSAITGLLLIIFSVFLLRLIASDILKIPGFGGEETTTTPIDTTRPIYCCAQNEQRCPAPDQESGPCTENRGVITVTGVGCYRQCENILLPTLTPTITPTPAPPLPTALSLGLSLTHNPVIIYTNTDVTYTVNGTISDTNTYSTLMVMYDQNDQLIECKEISQTNKEFILKAPNTPQTINYYLVASYMNCSNLPKVKNVNNEEEVTIQFGNSINVLQQSNVSQPTLPPTFSLGLSLNYDPIIVRAGSEITFTANGLNTDTTPYSILFMLYNEQKNLLWCGPVSQTLNEWSIKIPDTPNQRVNAYLVATYKECNDFFTIQEPNVPDNSTVQVQKPINILTP